MNVPAVPDPNARPHARIAISALARTVQCHASVQLSEPFLNAPKTEDELEGDAGHWVALQMQQRRPVKIGDPTPQGLPVDDDMLRGGQLWVDTVGHYGVAEVPVFATRIHPTDCWGYPDWYDYKPIESLIDVADYKFGRRHHEVFGHWQCIGYVAAVLDQVGRHDSELEVRIRIVQPRSYHKDGPVREWRLPASDLRAYINIAHGAAIRAIPPVQLPGQVIEATVGEECLFCPARHVCGTLQHAANTALAYSQTADMVNPGAESLGVELELLEAAAKIIEARTTGLQEQAEAMIRRGIRVPGYVLDTTRGKWRWLDTADKNEIANMCALLKPGLDVRKPLELITPTQAKDAGVDETILNLYADRPPGAMKLSKEIDARKIFGKIFGAKRHGK